MIIRSGTRSSSSSSLLHVTTATRSATRGGWRAALSPRPSRAFSSTRPSFIVSSNTLRPSSLTITSTPRTSRLTHPATTPSPPPTINFLRSFFRTPANPDQVMAAKAKAQQIIDDNAVAVFSKSYCPYCKATKALLSEQGAKAYIIELDQVDDGAAIQDALEEMTKQRSVPNIFIKQKHIGGNSDLQAKKGELPTLLKEAGAV